ncbi:hypothetical protein BJ742DRAFT_776629 [Cladochytrium replicatum]|nr:hypothetical protein BJ742DRAFT_776629 [Cladochytrium replicatum]
MLGAERIPSRSASPQLELQVQPQQAPVRTVRFDSTERFEDTFEFEEDEEGLIAYSDSPASPSSPLPPPRQQKKAWSLFSWKSSSSSTAAAQLPEQQQQPRPLSPLPPHNSKPLKTALKKSSSYPPQHHAPPSPPLTPNSDDDDDLLESEEIEDLQGGGSSRRRIELTESSIAEIREEIETKHAHQPPSLSAVAPNLLSTALSNLVLPVIIYYLTVSVFKGHQILGLALSAVPPAAESLYLLYSRGRMDAISSIVFISIVLNMAILGITSSTTVGLLRESFVTSLFGAVFLLSILYPRPWTTVGRWLWKRINLLIGRRVSFTQSKSHDGVDAESNNIADSCSPDRMSKNLAFYLARELGGTNEKRQTVSVQTAARSSSSTRTSTTHEMTAYFDHLWETSYGFRIATERLSRVWGITLLIESIVRCVLAFALQDVSVEWFLIASPTLFAVTVGTLVGGSVWYLRRVVEEEAAKALAEAELELGEGTGVEERGVRVRQENRGRSWFGWLRDRSFSSAPIQLKMGGRDKSSSLPSGTGRYSKMVG